RQAPLGPSSTTVPPATSRIVQPSTVVGRVSGTAAGLEKTFVRSCVAAGAMLLVVDGSLLPAALARRGLRERSCQRLTSLAPGAAWPALELAAAGGGGLGGSARHRLPIRFGGAGDLLAGLSRTTWGTRLLDGRRGRRGGEEARRAHASDPSHAKRHRERAGDE